MVRWQPPPSPSAGELVLGHDAVALSFFVACVAATVALTSSMCSACGRKAKPAADADPAASDQQQAGTGSVSVSGGGQVAGAVAGEEDEEEEVVVLSPELALHGAIDPVALPKSTSKRRLSISVSKKLSMNIPDKLRLSRREHKDHNHHKGESEDTLWKKGIILGEKCRIPGEREAECGTPVDPADEIAAESFRRSSYSRPVSRSSSFAMYQQTPPAPTTPTPQQQHDVPALHGSGS